MFYSLIKKPKSQPHKYAAWCLNPQRHIPHYHSLHCRGSALGIILTTHLDSMPCSTLVTVLFRSDFHSEHQAGLSKLQQVLITPTADRTVAGRETWSLVHQNSLLVTACYPTGSTNSCKPHKPL